MKTLIIMGGSLLAISLIVFAAYQDEAQAKTIIEQKRIKIILTFDLPGQTEDKVRTYFENNIEPDLQTIVTTRMNNVFDPGWRIDYKLKVTNSHDDSYEIYPKMLISGTTDLTPAQLRNGFDNTLADMKNTVKPHLQIFNAQNIKYKVYLESGSVWQLD